MLIDLTPSEISFLKVAAKLCLQQGNVVELDYAISAMEKINRAYNECVLAAQQSKRPSKV